MARFHVKHLLVLGLLPAFPALAGWPLYGPEAIPLPTVAEPTERLQPASPTWSTPIGTDARDLAAVADSAAAHLQRHDVAGDAAPHGLLDAVGIRPEDLRDTLHFITRIAREDAGRPAQRLEDPDFIATHFDAYRFRGDTEMAADNGVALKPGQVRITKYLVYQHEGRTEPDGEHATGLWAIPHDEAELTLDEADAIGTLHRHQFTRKQVLDGVFDVGGEQEGGATALAWMRRQDVHEALMQGTVELTFPTGATRTYNVHRSNGIAYRHAVRDPEQQDRFWYFREVDGVRGWGEEAEDKVLLQAGAAVAGDVRNLGLGALFAIQGTRSLRLTILADTGGAFEPNLYQLDFFAGAYPSRAAFDAAVADIPARTRVWLLVVKPEFTD